MSNSSPGSSESQRSSQQPFPTLSRDAEWSEMLLLISQLNRGIDQVVLTVAKMISLTLRNMGRPPTAPPPPR